MQSTLQKFSYTVVVRGLLGGGSVVVRWMRAFAVVIEMDRGGMSVFGCSCFRNFVSGLVARRVFVAGNTDADARASPVVLLLANVSLLLLFS